MKKIITVLIIILFSISVYAGGWYISEEDLSYILPVWGKGAFTVPDGGIAWESTYSHDKSELRWDPTIDLVTHADGVADDDRVYTTQTRELRNSLYYGVSDRFQIRFDYPYVYKELSNPVDFFDFDGDTNQEFLADFLDNNASGDSYLEFKYRLPRYTSLTDFAFSFGFELPTGNRDNYPYIGTEKADMIYGFHFTTYQKRGGFFGEVSYKLGQDFYNEEGRKEREGRTFSYHLGWVYPFTVQFKSTIEIVGYKQGLTQLNDSNVFASERYFVGIGPGFRYSPSKEFSIFASMLMPVSDKPHFSESIRAQSPKDDYFYKVGLYWELR